MVDDDVIDGSVSIPFGATHIGIQADGLADPTGGLAGWHDRSRVARIGSQSAIAAGWRPERRRGRWRPDPAVGQRRRGRSLTPERSPPASRDR